MPTFGEVGAAEELLAGGFGGAGDHGGAAFGAGVGGGVSFFQ